MPAQDRLPVLLVFSAFLAILASLHLFFPVSQHPHEQRLLFRAGDGSLGTSVLKASTVALQATFHDAHRDTIVDASPAPASDAEPTSITSKVKGRVLSAGLVTATMGVDARGNRRQFARSLMPGDRVAKGQVLATIWSPELGEKKSALLAAASHLMFDEASLARLRSEGAPQQEVASAERQCQLDQARVDRAEELLRDLALDNQQIEAIRKSAAQLHAGSPDYTHADHWSEVELPAPQAGVLVEVHAAAGATVEPGAVLFRISTPPEQTAGGPSLGDEQQVLAQAIEP